MREQSPFPAGLMRPVFAAEILAALGLVLPGLVGVLPSLTALAATGLVPIMIGAVVLHASRREVPPAVVTADLLVLAVLVAGGRWLVIPL